jgi:hypothetical protein
MTGSLPRALLASQGHMTDNSLLRRPVRGVLSVGWQLVSDWRGLGKIGDLSGHKLLPLRQGSGAASLVCLAINEVAFGIEMIVQGGVDGNEFL